MCWKKCGIFSLVVSDTLLTRKQETILYRKWPHMYRKCVGFPDTRFDPWRLNTNILRGTCTVQLVLKRYCLVPGGVRDSKFYLSSLTPLIVLICWLISTATVTRSSALGHFSSVAASSWYRLQPLLGVVLWTTSVALLQVVDIDCSRY